MEGDERIDAEGQRLLWAENLTALCRDFVEIDVCQLPRLCDLEAALRRINPSKVTGPDRIHPSFCKMAPNWLAKKLFSQVLKIMTHGQEALCHKGGCLQPLWFLLSQHTHFESHCEEPSSHHS